MRYYYFRTSAATNKADKQNGEDTFFSSPGKERAPQNQTGFFDGGKSNFFSPVQTKSSLTIGAPDDKYEREADSMADRVVSGTYSPTPVIQSKCKECEEEEKVQKKELKYSPLIQRVAFESEEEGAVQTKGENGSEKINSKPAGSVGADLNNQLNAAKGRGGSLPEDTREEMETSFGTDFSKVKIHTGSHAEELSNQLNAQAFTNGHDIYFNKGKYDTATRHGKHLLAHELTHVVQQNGEKPPELQKQDVCEEEPVTEINPNYDEEQGVCYPPEEESPGINPVHQFAAKPFHSLATVTPELGIRLHSTPSPYDADYINKTGIASEDKIQKNGTSVTILGLGVNPHKGWAKIKTNDLLLGWIEQRFLNPHIPYPDIGNDAKTETKPKPDSFTKHLHYIELGDTVEGLIKTFYPDYNYKTGNDRRTIAHAFYIMNESSPGVRLSGTYDSSFWKDSVLDRGFSGSREIYGKIRLFAGHWVKFPNLNYIDTLRKLNLVSTRPDWKNQTIAVGRGIQGFFEGVVYGFAQAGVDMVVDLWDLVKDIFTGEIFKKGYDLVMQFIDLYEKEGIKGIWNVVAGFFKGIYDSFVTNWNNPNPRARWEFIGKIVGNILFEILLAWITGGAGTAAKWSARAAKVMKKFPALGKIVTTGTKKVGKLKDATIDKVSKAKALKLQKGLGFNDVQWTNYMNNKDTKWDVIKSKPELLDLEMKALKKSKPGISTIEGYDIEIKVPNGHIYRRKKPPGNGWCRFSELKQGCGEIPVDAYIEKNKIAQIEEDLGFREEYIGPHSEVKNPPGAKKQRERTALGTFVHSKAYTRFINWMESYEGKKWLKANNYSKADFALDLPSGKISREFIIDHPAYSKGLQPRIDVVDWDNALVHEIKPDGLIKKGYTESLQYAEWMNKYHPRADGKLWKAGRTIAYDSNKIYSIFKDFGYFD